MQKPYRVQWEERRPVRVGESVNYSVIAERYGSGWRFYERSTWEVQWFPIPASDKLCELAESYASRDSGGIGRVVHGAAGPAAGIPRRAVLSSNPSHYRRRSDYQNPPYNPVQDKRRKDYHNRGSR